MSSKSNTQSYLTMDDVTERFDEDAFQTLLSSYQTEIVKYVDLEAGSPPDADEQKLYYNLFRRRPMDYKDQSLIALLRSKLIEYYKTVIVQALADEEDHSSECEAAPVDTKPTNESSMPAEMKQQQQAECEQDEDGNVGEIVGDIGFVPDGSAFSAVDLDELAIEVVVFYSRMIVDVLFGQMENERYASRKKGVNEVIRAQKLKPSQIDVRATLRHIKTVQDFSNAVVTIVGKPGFSDLSPAFEGSGVLKGSVISWNGGIDVYTDFYPYYAYGDNTKTKAKLNNYTVIVPYLKSLGDITEFCVSCAYRSMFATGAAAYRQHFGDGAEVDDYKDTTGTQKGAQMAYLRALSYYAGKRETPTITCYFNRTKVTKTFAAMVETIIRKGYDTSEVEGLKRGRNFRGNSKSVFNTNFKEIDKFSEHKFSVTSTQNVVNYCSTSHKAKVLHEFLNDPSYEHLVYVGVTTGPNMHFVHTRTIWEQNHGETFSYCDIDFPPDSAHYIDLTDADSVATYFSRLGKDKETLLVVADVANDEMSSDTNDKIPVYLKNLAKYCRHAIIKFNMFQKCEFNFAYSPLFVKTTNVKYPYTLGGRRHNGEAFAWVDVSTACAAIHTPLSLLGETDNRATKTVQANREKWKCVFDLAKESNCSRGMAVGKLRIDHLSHGAYYPNKKNIKRIEMCIPTEAPAEWRAVPRLNAPDCVIVCGATTLKVNIGARVYEIAPGVVKDRKKFANYLDTFDIALKNAIDVEEIPGVA